MLIDEKCGVLSRREFVGRLSAGAALAAAAVLRPGLAAGAQTSPKTYTNPVYAGSMPDPFVLRHRGVYYAFGTTGGERKSDGRIYTVLRSTDLVEWRELGGALEAPSPDPAYQYWAPEVAFDGRMFYLYYSMGGKEEEKFEIRVATSRRPEGPYKDTGDKLLDCERNRFTIDAHPFRDSDGRWYMFYARNFLDTAGGTHPGTALVVDRLIGMKRLAGECRTVLRARHPWTLYEANRRMNVYNATFDWHTIEGAVVRKHAGRYYLFYSGSNWQTPNYGVDYAVADKVTGPYTGQGAEARVLRGVPGKVRGPGHHSIVTGPDGKTEYFVYHAWDEAMKVRQMCIDRLVWTPDGPRLAAGGPTVAPQPRPALR
ncbi:MAG TPA: glycoside hydrolase family 43 protein [Pyrinomonadaceae bacterium]|nr:glycoside hydrolase family 43 protein [Pyrinomonadaceae bacterium]